jgi:hypothetical protein
VKLIPYQVTRAIARQALIAKKQSPHIFFGAGIVGFVGTTVLACRATLKLHDVADEFKADVEAVKELLGNTASHQYSEGEYQKDMAYAYGKGTLKIAKLYAPTAAVGIISIAALSGSHIAMTRRNAALMTALASVSKAYLSYRERVAVELGPDKELDLYHAAETHVVTNEDGSKEKIKVANKDGWSPYARFFDEASRHWEKNAEYNRTYVQCQQKHANDMLKSRGHVFLNEVYDMLGIERTREGSVVGWVMGNGDNEIDFGLYEASSLDFMRGWERNILLDFNVDGVIYNKI